MSQPNPPSAQTGSMGHVASNVNSRPTLEFWFEFASTYSYLSAMQIETIASNANIRIAWRPFLLGPIFKKQGWDTSPFNIQEAKGNYMWRDMERQCERLGLPLCRPFPFPQNSLLATRIAYCAQNEGWIGEYVRAVYMAEFGQGLDISEEELHANLLMELGAPAQQLLLDVGSPETKSGLRESVARAEGLGIFGAPSFVTPNGDLFWGNDRLHDAVEATAATLEPGPSSGPL